MVKLLQLGCLGILLLPSLASAQIKLRERIQFPSGEVLIGEVISETRKTIVFKSEGLGTLNIPLTPDLLRIPIKGSETTSAQQGVSPAAMTIAPSVETDEKPAATWKRKLEGGFSLQQRGNTDSNYAASLRAQITRKAGANDFKAHLRYIVADQNDERSTDRLDAGLSLNHYLQTRLYLRSDLLYRFDRLREFSNDFEGSLGCAYYFWKNDRVRLWLGPGAALNYSEPNLGDNGYRWLGDIHSGLDLRFNKHFSFEHRGVYLYKFEDLNDYRLRLDEALKAIVNEHITVGLRYEFEYESILPIEDGRGEHRFFSTVELSY